MNTICYVMRKTELPHSHLIKYIIIRYKFENNRMVERFWVNTYDKERDAKEYFNNILDNAKHYNWNIIKGVYCKNIWEIQYAY